MITAKKRLEPSAHPYIKWVLICWLGLFMFGLSGDRNKEKDSRWEGKRTPPTEKNLSYEDSESQLGPRFYKRAEKKPTDTRVTAYKEARRQGDEAKMRELESQFRKPALKVGESVGDFSAPVSATVGTPGEPAVTNEPSGFDPFISPDWGTDIHVRSVNTTFRESHPAMATASDGTIYAVWENFGQPGSFGYLQIYYSTDGGNTWMAYGYISNPTYDLSEPSLAIGEGAQNYLLLAWVVDDGSVPHIEVGYTPLISGGFSLTVVTPPYLTFWEGYRKPNIWTDSYDWAAWYGYLTAEAAIDSLASNYNVVFWSSTDYGATWGTDHQVPLGNTDPDAWRDPDGTYGTTADNLYIACFNETDNTLYTLISPDFGASWSDTVSIYTLPTLPVNPVDPDIEAATNTDNIQLVCTKSFSGNDNIGQTFSTDGGYTWSFLYSLEGYTAVNEFAPELTANEGGASWHVAYTTQDWWVYYSTRPQDLSNFWLLTPELVNDIDWASAAYPKKAITSNWGSDDAGVAWTDYRDGLPDYDIYYDYRSAGGGAVANDECATATVIPGPPYTDNVNTTLATPNPSDPVLSCGAGGGGNTVWYVYTPASATWVSANTIGSDYDTVLGLFTGSCGSLVEESCNDDAVGLQSEIIWEAHAGVTYYILVAEFGGGSGGGNLVFNLDPATPPALYQGPAVGSIAGGAPQNTSSFPLAPKTRVDGRKVREKLIPYRETDRAPATKYLTEPAAPLGSNEIDDIPSSPIDQPNLVQDFAGIPDDANSAGFSFIPPDPTCAVGPNHVMACTNTDFAIFDKSGNKLQEIDATLWFENVLPGLDPALVEPFGAAFDPQIVYDHFADRWIMIYIASDFVGQSYLLVSTSDDADPFGMWCNFAIPGNANGSTFNTNLNDYPKLGVNQDAIYVTANMFDLVSGGFQYVQVRFFEKSQFYNNTCGPISWTDFWDLRDPDNLSTVLNTASTVVPAVTYGFPGVEYLINASPYVTGTFMTLWTLYDPLGSPYMTAVNIPVAAYDWPPNADQLGGGTPLIDVGGWRVRNAVFRDGFVWTAHSIADATLSYSRARYVKVDVATLAAMEDISYGLTDFWYYYPAITADASGNSIMVMNRSGLSEYAGIRYTGTVGGTPHPSAELKAGEANYVKTFGGSRNRWGDYSGIAVDPVDPDHVWMFAEYAASPANTWGTWWGEVTYAPVAFPDIRVVPTSFTFNVPVNGSDAAVLTIFNDGTAPLTWDMTEQTTLTLSKRTQEKTLKPTQVNQGVPLAKDNHLVKTPTAIELFKDGSSIGILAPAAPECASGEIHDDGTAENGYGWNSATVTEGENVELFGPVSLPINYTQICMCLTRTGTDADFSFDIQVYDDDGPGGEPGTLLASIPVTAVGVPIWPSVAFYDFDVTGLIPTINNPGVYIGLHWFPNVEQDFFICSDESPTTPLQTGYARDDFDGNIWTPMQNFWGGYRALFIRAESGGVVDCPWISENPTSGTVPPGGSQQVNINVDATGLAPGTYTCNLIINSNDPDENPLIVPVTMNVGSGCSGVAVGEVLCPGNAPQNSTVTVEIKVDMSGVNPPDDLLGSFTATLSYDPALVSFNAHSGILSGFSGVVNVDNVAGVITFNGAKPTGAGGLVDILNVDFDAIGPIGSTVLMDLQFSAMSAALTFTDLLPCLTVNDCTFDIVTPCLLGDINGDGQCNSTDALIILSYDVGLPIPQPFLDRILLGCGDTNADGFTNSTDALIILSFDVGITVPFPVCQ